MIDDDDIWFRRFFHGVLAVVVIVVFLAAAGCNTSRMPNRNYAQSAGGKSSVPRHGDINNNQLRPPSVPLPDTSDVVEKFPVADVESLVIVNDYNRMHKVINNAKWITIRLVGKTSKKPLKNTRVDWETDQLFGTTRTDERGVCKVMAINHVCDSVTIPTHPFRRYWVSEYSNHKIAVEEWQ